MALISIIVKAMPNVVAVLLRRAAPFILYTCISPRVSIHSKAIIIALTALLCHAILAYGILPKEVIVVAFAMYVYFALVGTVVYILRNCMQKGSVGKLFVLCFAAYAYTLIPAILFRGPLYVSIQVIGWEAILSAYSLCVDTSKGNEKIKYSDCLFFLLVNPTLVYSDRGKMVRAMGINRRGLFRCILGVSAIAAHFGIYTAMISNTKLRTIELDKITSLSNYAQFVLYFGTHLIMLYIGHSGRASFEIGMMRFLGWEIPERYRYAFLSRSPSEFWRRWNTYVGGWAKRYIFLPFVLHWQRKARHVPSSVISTIAILVTFGAIGLAHDYSLYPRNQFTWSIAGMVAFLFCALLLILWNGVAWVLTAPYPPNSNGFPKQNHSIPFAASWLILAHIMVVAGWILVPSLSGQGLPPIISQYIPDKISMF